MVKIILIFIPIFLGIYLMIGIQLSGCLLYESEYEDFFTFLWPLLIIPGIVYLIVNFYKCIVFVIKWSIDIWRNRD